MYQFLEGIHMKMAVSITARIVVGIPRGINVEFSNIIPKRNYLTLE